MEQTTTAFELDGQVLLVGAGKMGGALLEGWLAAGVPASQIAVLESAPSPQLEALAKGHPFLRALAPGSAEPAVIVMAVKPQVMDEVFAAVAPHAGAKTVTLSIAAGTTLASFERRLGPGAAVVRAMPNTPASIGRGITVLCANRHTSAARRALCERLMGAVGETGWIADETLMDAVTAVSGSGPAYVFLLAEALAQAGAKAGLAPDLAAKLARETIAGSGELLHRQPDVTAEQLRMNVTSPGGTTAAALEVLMAPGGLELLMERAVAAAVARGAALGKSPATSWPAS